MTDITDQDRRDSRQWASLISKGTIVAFDYGLMIDEFDIFKRNDPTQPMWADRPLMLRQGDRLVPLVQAGVHDGHIFVETWDSYGPRSERGDRQ